MTTVMTRVSDALRSRLSSRQFNQASISFHLFPEEHERAYFAAMPGNPALYPDWRRVTRREAGTRVKPTVLIATTSTLVSDGAAGDGSGPCGVHGGCGLSRRASARQDQRGAPNLSATGA